MVLVGRDCGELSLWEDEGLEVLGVAGTLLLVLVSTSWCHVADVETGLVSVHGVQDHLIREVQDTFQRG